MDKALAVCALRSRVLPPHRGAGHLPSVVQKGCGLRDYVSRIDRRDLMASFCGRQGVLQPPGSRLPESQLYLLRHDIQGCSLHVSINCTVALLLNSPSLAVVLQAGSGSALGVRSGYGGGSVGSATTMLTLLTGSATREPVPLIGGKRKNPTLIPEVVAIMQGLREETRRRYERPHEVQKIDDRGNRNRRQSSVPRHQVL
jgi:hypothetical protein